MLLDPNGGCMALPDLRDLIETRIPEHRAQLETSHVNLENVAAFCENNYLNNTDKYTAFEETKQYALQSLASVAYQINTLARDMLDMLSLQTDKISVLSNNVENINMIVNINKEKMARREIGVLTTNKSVPKQPKIISPQNIEPMSRYKRTPIDFSLLDGVGHGVKTEAPRPALVSRAPSTLSGTNHYGYCGQYERTANISSSTLSRSSLRSGPMMHSGPQNDHYRVPAVMPMLDPGRYSTSLSQPYQPELNSDNMCTPTSNDHGSIQGSSEYGSATYTSGLGDRYGTLRPQQARSNQHRPEQLNTPSPILPPPPQIGQHVYNCNIDLRDDAALFPAPPSPLMQSSMDEEPLPPPPVNTSFFDVQSEWIPRDGEYIEKAVALYDYEADKPDELTLRENCLVYVLRKNEDGWFEGILDGVTGLFPGNYVRPV